MLDSSLSPMVEKMLRVNHAGEYGAKRIYEGQLSVLKNTSYAPLIRDMAEQEEKHLHFFDTLVKTYHVEPTKLMPLWHVLGYGLGAASALLGHKAAMACTAAVEEVIDTHYQEQLKKLKSVHPNYEESLYTVIEDCHKDEVSHRDIAFENEAKRLPGYTFFTSFIKAGTRIAIMLSKRI